MSTAVRDKRNPQSADPWLQRVDAGDWDAITAEIDEYGGALLPQLLTAGETARVRSWYTDDGLFRSTINMGRHRFGEGEYRYFKSPYPEPVERLKQALYPRLLPIARDWWAKLHRPLLEEQELAPGVIDPGFVQVDDDLQGEDEVTVEVAVQRVPVSLAVAQQNGR